MRFVRFKTAGSKPQGASNDEMKGLLEDNGQIRRIYGSYLQAFSVTEQLFDTADIEYLPPVLPITILCASAANTQSYIKSPSSLAGSGAIIELPAGECLIYCTPRIAWVVKNRNHDKLSGATLFGYTYMLDFAMGHESGNAFGSSANYTVLGRSIDTELASAPLPLPAVAIKAFAERINFHPGDIIAFAAEGAKSYKRGERVSFGDVEAAIQ